MMSFEGLERARLARRLKDAETAAKKVRNATWKNARNTADIARAGSGEGVHVLTRNVPAPESHTVDAPMG